jgi:hypothetical protein
LTPSFCERHETAKGSKQEVGVKLIGDAVLTDPWKHFKTFAGNKGFGVVEFMFDVEMFELVVTPFVTFTVIGGFGVVTLESIDLTLKLFVSKKIGGGFGVVIFKLVVTMFEVLNGLFFNSAKNAKLHPSV